MMIYKLITMAPTGSITDNSLGLISPSIAFEPKSV
jgi:hypothetical protein